VSRKPYSTPRSWSELLSVTLERKVEVRFGHARRQVIVVQDKGHVLAVRMNAIFGEAPLGVAESVAKWMRNGRRARQACRRLDAWIAEIEPRLKPGREVRLRSQGEHFDLSPMMEALISDEFRRIEFKNPDPKITWGRRSSSRPRRSLQLGSFDPETGVIRIHPVLDQAAVPHFFVRYVVFHELVHAALGDEPAGPTGRRPHHGPLFRRAEEAYADYARALEWQDDNIRDLMRSARTGKPMKAPKKTNMPQLDLDLASQQLFLF